ncbi:EFR1 family ferrodoxin [Clostridium sp. 'White wine YQ']|uniref:EFR1 family ferrodoxin n=1 Tax=Clostridium sp. 'White wine YQ' TaxID=3027474 RepID=UPI0023670DFC|nr:EFR1 family ferrodoxin [Clostridium sp. 'White wine YQ']MDD7794175.1 EFR1 family ferrodoxin [Clostridium sp. 'White wine YQ']
MDKCLIHYFSGTGNTNSMVMLLADELYKSGYEADLVNIEKDNDRKLGNYELHIFCYPIYGFGTPEIMLRYISNIKNPIYSKAAIVCTSAGFEGQSLFSLKRILSKKGFKVVLTDMVTYDYNWTQIFNPKPKEKQKEIFREAEKETREVAKKLINNETRFKNRNIVTLAISWIIFIIFNNLGRKFLGKTYIADNSCNNCSKCKNICPVNAIEMQSGKPKWSWRCESCQRCINMCPKKSIQLSIVKLTIYGLFQLSPIFLLAEIDKRIYDLPILIDIFSYCVMFGVNSILANLLINIMEKCSITRKILQISYTKNYRRNVAKDFYLS